ncbi:MAG: phosphoribosylaminoimidazolesuccinocarboxamide synthase [Lachnospiraceae bacterium]|jgi:phosphoribosylaminoimidazole-succinocarboxamide synthase|nr:phosphoribosylaminoimidazolesuccinocarboxamide synthase [Lachnospiraceae bacterium]
MNKISSGKVREIYDIDEDKLLLVVSDRISAFDVILPSLIPNKGKVLNKISDFWFDFTKDIVKNHVISTDIKDFPAEFQKPEFEGRSMLVKKLKMLPIECIVRGYITGSGWASYKENGTVCGIQLPAGLQESEKLPDALFTPSTKADLGDHDENISFEKTCEIIGEELGTKLRDKTIEVYKKCAEYALSKGIIIADTKFEFGLDESGELVLADEVLTPDSSRFWPADSYVVGKSQSSFDKQYIRDWLKQNNWNSENPSPLPEEVISTTSKKYIEAYELLTGKTF